MTLQDNLLSLREAASASRALQAQLVAELENALFIALASEICPGLEGDALRQALLPDPLGFSQPRLPAVKHWPPAGWLATGLRGDERGTPLVEFTCFEGLASGDPFFLSATTRARARPFNRICNYTIALDDLATVAPDVPPPAGFIFHMSRCGSTLAHRMLDACGAVRSIGEPAAFDAAIALCLAWNGPDAAKCRILRAIAAGLNNMGDGLPLVIKLDSWHVLSWPLLHMAFPQTPAIFLCREPVEVLVSHQRRRGLQMTPQPSLAKLCGIDGFEELSLDEYAARILGSVCRAARTLAAATGMPCIDYRDLPQAVIARIVPHFGLAADDAVAKRMRAAASFDSKVPHELHKSDSAAKQAEAEDVLRSLSAEHIEPHYRALLDRRD